MINLGFLAATGLTALVTLGLSATPWVAWLVVTGTAAAVAGAGLRRYPAVLTGLVLLGVAFGIAVTSSQREPGIWLGLLVGSALFGAAEFGFDWVVVVRTRTDSATYRGRLRHVVGSCALATGGLVLVTGIAAGLRGRVPALDTAASLWLGAPAVVVIMALLWGVLKWWTTQTK